MAQGTRGRWVRAATTGFGVLVCTGLVGCMNWDKPKETKATAQPKAGLPGTPTLSQGTGVAKQPWQPGGQYGTPGTNLQQTGGFGTAQPGGSFRSGTTGINTNTSGTSQPNNWPAQPGNPGSLGAPAQPGLFPSVQPPGAPVGAAPYSYSGGVAQAGYTPPAPALIPDGPLPPPAPPLAGSFGSTEVAGGVAPPVPSGGPLAPPIPPGLGPTYPTKGGF